MQSASHRGFSTFEILVSVALVSFALIPLINLFVTGRRSATLTEHHILAQMRAQRILEAFASHPYRALARDAQGGGLTVPLPASEPAFPPEYREKISAYEEQVSFEEQKPGLGCLVVDIAWTHASDGKRRELHLERLVADESLSLTDSFPLRQKGAGP